MISFRQILRYVMPGVMLLALFASCEREIIDAGNTDITFNARIEQPGNVDAAKLHLVDERWIYWEIGDKISIGSNMNACVGDGNPDHNYSARLVNIGDLNEEGQNDFGYFNGVFITTMGWGSTKFVGIHPENDSNKISTDFSDIRVMLPRLQTLRGDPTRDFTFAKQMLPMVGWYGDEWVDDTTAYNLDFHSLGAIVRLQVYNATNNDYTLDKIVITSRDPNRPLSGRLRVKGNTYQTEDPYFDDSYRDEANNSITLCKVNNGQAASLGITLPHDGGVSDTSRMRTFYLILPAYKSRHDSTQFHLTMTLYADGGTHTCTRNFNVNTRRNNITYLNAIGVDNWETHHGVIGLTGNGTQERPFKVYSIADLKKVRDAYNSPDGSGKRYINNIELTENTYICLMRSDIVLMDTNWASGIRNFKGHFYAQNHQSHPGIVDSCPNVPLFESVSAGGHVEGISLKCAASFNDHNLTGLSPFCQENAGEIVNCVITPIPNSSNVLRSIYSPLAGICVTNSGTIEGCRCEGRFEVQTGQNFAGICLHNLSGGKILGCQFSGASLTATGNAAGICYENQSGGVVKDCYYASEITGTSADWGGIVYDNAGTVEHCYFSATGTLRSTSKSVGGIVRNNLGGTVDYCWLAGKLEGTSVGGIVDSLVSGTVINCFNEDRAMAMLLHSSRENVVGGLVGYLKGGSIANSYVYDLAFFRANQSDVMGGIVGKAMGGTVTNCYTLNDANIFYGTTTVDSYSRCFLVDGSQSNITSISESLATAATGVENCLVDRLNAASGFPEGGKAWSNTAGSFPHLAPYTLPTAKRRHPRR